VILVEIGLRLPFLPVVAVIAGTGKRGMHVMMSKSISDHWKEKVMLAYSGRMFRATLKLATLLIVLFGGAGVIVWLLDHLGTGFASFILGWQGIFATLVLASLYFILRKRIVHG
jgi:hypothetical protein